MPSRRSPLAALPAWPRYLTREEAARYTGVSIDVWDDEVRAGFWPAPRLRGAKGGLPTWDRVLLDAAADREAGLTPAEDESRPPAPVSDAVEQDWRGRLTHGKAAKQPGETRPKAAR